MKNTITNISTILGIAVIAFALYYMYDLKSDTVLSEDISEQTREKMLKDTKEFKEYGLILQKESILDISILDDERFLNLRDFSTDIQESDIGRSNPFSEAGKSSNSVAQ